MEHFHVQPFLDHAVLRAFKAKSTIIYEGDHADTIYYIINGSVSVVATDDDGHEIVLAYLKAGDFIGEMGLFNQSQQRTASVTARSNCELACMNYTQFKELAMQQAQLMFAIAGQISQRLRSTNTKARDLAFVNVAGRVAHCLLDLAGQPDAVKNDKGTIINVTRQEVARLVGCSREMVSRVLSELEGEGLIEVPGKKIIVLGT